MWYSMDVKKQLLLQIDRYLKMKLLKKNILILLNHFTLDMLNVLKIQSLIKLSARVSLMHA